MVRNTKNYAKKRITAPKLSPLASAIKLSLLGLGLGLSNGAAHADTINVTTRFDNLNDGHECTLRDAITSFNTGVVSSGCELTSDALGYNIIEFDDSLANQTIFLTNGELSIASGTPLFIQGNNITVDAQEDSRVFTVQSNARFRASGLNITGGKVSGGGGAGNGGGIRVLSGALLNLFDTTVSNNDAEDDGGAIFLVGGSADIKNSTISSNTGGRNGAGIDVAYNSSLTLVNSTVSGNTSSTANRSVISARGSTSRILMYNNTIANNTTNNGASLDVQGASSVSVTDSIIAGTVNGVDCRAAGSSSLTVNNTSIIQSGGCPGQAVDPVLGPLDDNGGPTRTHALLENSPAIDPAAGSNLVISFRDQRGFGIVGATRDVGAFEFGSTPGLNFTVDSTSDTTAATNNSTECTLREAIASVNAESVLANGCVNDPTTVAGDPTVIKFAENVVGNTIPLSQGELAINRNMSINPVNLSGNTTTIDANERSGVFVVRNADVSFNHLTITGGSSFINGGGISAFRSDVNLNNSTVSGNSAEFSGGGIYASYGNVSLSNSTVSGNSAGSRGPGGGGIFTSVGNLSLSNSIVSGNSASSDGGGFRSSDGIVNLNNSTVSGNSASLRGGGFYSSLGTVNLNNSTVSGNSASFSGGGFYSSSDTVTVSNSIVANSEGGACSSANSTLTITDSISDDASCGGATQVPNALLGPLADNGGPTLTHALLPGSPAINIGNANCPITDQRGETRDASCDAGAFEFIEEEACFVVKAANGNVITFCL